MTEQDDFFEVNNQVPFQAIKHIKVENVTVKQQGICVRSCMTLIRGSEGQLVDLIRTDKDFDWLLANIASNGHCPLLPKIDSQGMFSLMVNLIGGGQPTRVNKLKILKQRVLTRCLTIISTLLLQHLRTVNQEYQLPIFVFFHQNFALYHNPIYFKEETVSIKKKVGNYFWQKYALFTGKGNTWQQLESTKKNIIIERERLAEVTYKLQEYLSQLNKLQDQFIQEKQKIKKRTVYVQELTLSFQMQLKYLDLVVEEVKETAYRAQQQRSQSQKLIFNYTILLQQQISEAAKANQKLIGEYVKVICQNEDKLKIAPY